MPSRLSIWAAAMLAGASGVSATVCTVHDYPSAAAYIYNPPACGIPYASLDLSRVTALGTITGNYDPNCGACIEVCGSVGCANLMVIDKSTREADGNHLDVSIPAGPGIFGDNTGVHTVSYKFVEAALCKDIWNGEGAITETGNWKTYLDMQSGGGGDTAPAAPAPEQPASPPAAQSPAPAPSVPEVLAPVSQVVAPVAEVIAPAPSANEAPPAAEPPAAAPVIDTPVVDVPAIAPAPVVFAPDAAPAPSSAQTPYEPRFSTAERQPAETPYAPAPAPETPAESPAPAPSSAAQTTLVMSTIRTTSKIYSTTTVTLTREDAPPASSATPTPTPTLIPSAVISSAIVPSGTGVVITPSNGTNGTLPTPSPPAFTGAATRSGSALGLAAAGMAAVLFL